MIIRDILDNVASVLDLDADQVGIALEAFCKAPCRVKALFSGVSKGTEARMMKAIRLYFMSVLWKEWVSDKIAEPIASSILKSVTGENQEAAVEAYIGMVRQHKGHPALAGSAVQSTPMTRRNEM